MGSSQVLRDHVRRWPRRLAFAFAAALVAVIALRSGGLSSPENVHGSVFDWARANPGSDVPVLVQTSDPDGVAGLIQGSGGSVTRQFQIIPVLEAAVSPAFVFTLASDPDVAGISLNAPVVTAGKGGTKSGTTSTDTGDGGGSGGKGGGKNGMTGSGDSTSSTTTTTSSSDAGPAVPATCAQTSTATGTVSASDRNLATVYPVAVNAHDPWGKGYTGAGIGVAIVDTGVTHSADFGTRVVCDVTVNANATSTADGFGHGTHIAGIVGGYGSAGKYIGIAPGASIINVKIADDAGNATLGDIIAGLEFVYNQKATYNIRVVNLSLHSGTAQSYKTDPLCAAVEFLWFNGIFVVAAAGNMGTASDSVNHCPGNDPFVMTVGAIDERATSSYGDDVPTVWSSYGTTQDGFKKPELLAPGRFIVSPTNTASLLYKSYPDRVVSGEYFRLSGTSMATGVMSGLAALVLERHPNWTPGELKCTLIKRGRHLASPYDMFWVPRAGATSNQSSPDCNSDVGLTPSDLILRAPAVVPPGVIAYVLGSPDPAATAREIGLDLTAAGIAGRTLETVDWSAVRWDLIRWDLIRFDLVRWDVIRWDLIRFDLIRWDLVRWDLIQFDLVRWDLIRWSAIRWSAIRWSAIRWSAIRWSAIRWSAVRWSAATELDAAQFNAARWDFILKD